MLTALQHVSMPTEAFRGLIPSIWEPAATLEAWAAVLCVAFSVWAFHFIQRQKPDAIRKEQERKRDYILALMKAVIEYSDQESTKPESERTLPEASRLFTLLYDDVHGCRTLAYGVPRDGTLNRSIEDLYRRCAEAEFRETCELTRRARTLNESERRNRSDKEEAKKLEAHVSGEKLLQQIRSQQEVRAKLGRNFTIPEALRHEAVALVKTVRNERSKNMRSLFAMMMPVLPSVIYSSCIGMLHTALRSKFHQIGLWVQCIEAGVNGDTQGALSMLFNLWVGHMIIKLIELPEFCYTKRSKNSFGNIIRNGVLSAMVRQDYEYFDRTPAGVLQDRLNKDADELGENLIGFPKEMLNKAVWVLCNLYQVWVVAPPAFFAAACCPVFLMTAFQWFTFRYFRDCNERARRIEEEGVSATSEVLRNIKTVRQLASERRAAATYARRNLARQLIGESVSTFKRALEVVVWCIFDSGICATILLGLPYVQAGELSAGQLIDCFCKLNFNVNFCLREILEQLPRIARLLEPMGRICELLQAVPQIEPPGEPAHVHAADAAHLWTLLGRCSARLDINGAARIRLMGEADGAAAADADGNALARPAIGAELLCLTTADHRHVAPHELLLHPSPADGKEAGEVAGEADMQVPAALTYPVRAIFSTKRRPHRFRGHIEFRDVHFAYPTDLRRPVLRGLSFSVSPGQKVALVGPTGCGKSSCMSLLQRLYEPDKGAILLDGASLADLDVQHLRSRVVIVDQATVLFSATIKDNITYGLERHVSDAEVIAACEQARAWDFISEKPDKLMTWLAGGANLSGGQRQRLAIARAIIRRPDVILLDEATSALDNENEAQVQKALDVLARHGSSLVIAHRLSTIRDADQIIVVDHGRAVEMGTHEELLARLTPSAAIARHDSDGAPSVTYRRLWDAAHGQDASQLTIDEVQQKMASLEEQMSSLRARRDAVLASSPLASKYTVSPSESFTTLSDLSSTDESDNKSDEPEREETRRQLQTYDDE